MRLSPLFGTAMVAVVLGLLAIPLQRLTGSAAVAAPLPGPAMAGQEKRATPAVVRLRLLREAVTVELSSDDANLLWRAEKVPAGETEADIPLPLVDHEAVLHLRATFPDDGTETAVFVTVMPDGYEERTSHAIGSTSIEERLAFTWPQP